MIRSQLGFDERDDYTSASILNYMVKGYNEEELIDLIKGRSVAVIGAGPQLTKLKKVEEDVII
ncbi:MAG: hypothetical protein QXS44_05600, partial [Saccharolobus sp.]